LRALATLRSHAVTVLVTIGAVAAVVLTAVVAIGSGPPSVAFREPGHWVYNRIERAALHVDAGTGRVDARVDVPSSAGDPLMVLQGHREGYVVARDAVSPFARAALTVGAPAPAARDEVPVGVEVVGGPYLVYRQAGTIVRLGEPRTSVEVGGPVSAPVRGADGTVWVHRPDTGEVCGLRSGAVTLDCTARTAPGTAGALTVVAGRPAWLDPAAGTLADLAQGSASPITLGRPAGPILVADAEVGGRLPVVAPDGNALVLADLGGGAPAVVDLGPGRWAAPVTAGNAVAVLDLDGSRLRTFDAGGAPLGTAELAPGATGPVPGGDGRLYVDDPQGTATAVVGPDGSVTTVPTGGGATGPVARAATAVRVEAPAGPAPAGSPQRDDRAVAVPRAPTGVAVKRQGDVLTVTWRAPAATVDHYTVVLNRAVATTTTATSATLRSPAGRPVRVAVSATNTAGTGPLSTVVTAAAAVARPGAPVGLTLAAGDGPRPYAFAPSWKAPDLGGGALVRYEVSWTSATGARTTRTTTGTSLPPIAGDPCAAPYTVAVRAVTRTPAGRLLTGPPATSSAPAPPGGSCAVRMTLDAAADGADTITVTATDDGGATGPCVLSVDGTVRWSGTCGDRARTRIPVGGLDPDTTYTVVLTARNPDGSTTRTDPVSVTTD
jgi:hypothetical protein